MNVVLFKELVRIWHRKFTKEKKIAPIINNCPSHSTIHNLTPTPIIYLPPSTTSKIQPTDLGVIRSLKASYKSRGGRSNQQGKRSVFSILEAIKLLDLASQRVKSSTIVNGFAKAWLSKEQQSAQLDDYETIKSWMIMKPSKIFKIKKKSLVIFTLLAQQPKMSFRQTKMWWV